jgi:hypothetical protein
MNKLNVKINFLCVYPVTGSMATSDSYYWNENKVSSRAGLVFIIFIAKALKVDIADQVVTVYKQARSST